jgi:hypothetical protein
MRIVKDDITVIVGPAPDEVSVLMGGACYVLSLEEAGQLQRGVRTALRQIMAAHHDKTQPTEAGAVTTETLLPETEVSGSALMDFVEAQLRQEPFEIPEFLRAS